MVCSFIIWLTMLSYKDCIERLKSEPVIRCFWREKESVYNMEENKVETNEVQTNKVEMNNIDATKIEEIKEDENKLEALLRENNRLLKQQINLTRILLFAVILFVVGLFAGGSYIGGKLKDFDLVVSGIEDMTDQIAELDVESFNATMKEFGEKVSKLNIDGLNDTIDTLNEMALKVDQVNDQLEQFKEKFGFMFGS